MKTRLFTLLVSFYPLICSGQSEFTWDIQKMTADGMHAQFKEIAAKTALVEPHLKLIRDAIDARRLDLVQAAFTDFFASTDTFFTIKAMPDSEFRRKVAIMMMRVPKSSAWLPDKMPGVFKNPQGNGVQEPFITTVEALIPGETLVPEMVVNSTARFKLADRLYAAMQAKGVPFTDTEKAILQGGATEVSAAPSTPPGPTNAPVVKTAAPVVPKKMPQFELASAPTNTVQDPDRIENFVFWIPIIGLVAIGLWALTRK